MAPAPSTPSRRGFAALALTAVLLLGACGDDDDTSTTTTTTTATTTTSSSTTASTTTTTVDPQVEIEAAVQAYFGFFVEYLGQETIDPADERVEQFATGTAARILRDSARDFVNTDQRIRPPDGESVFSLTIESTSGNGDDFIADACLIDDYVVYDKSTGEAVNEAIEVSLVEYRLTRVDGRLLVSDSIRGNRSTAPATCDDLR